jgi:hypothetical protein
MACGIVSKESVYYWEFMLYGMVPFVVLYTLTVRILAQSTKNMLEEGQGQDTQK